jgi:hypothetical protein
MVHDYESKKKLWEFVTFQNKNDEIEIHEEIFNLNVEINQLRLMVESCEDYKKRLKLSKTLSNKIEALKDLKSKLPKNNT